MNFMYKLLLMLIKHDYWDSLGRNFATVEHSNFNYTAAESFRL